MLKFTRFSIQNFKSIEKIDLNLDTLTCIVGMNGAGKSTLLQALDFVSQLVAGRMGEWLSQRGWDIDHLTNQNVRPRTRFIQVELEMKDYGDAEECHDIKWEARFDTKKLQCDTESITVDEKEHFRLSNGKLLLRLEKPLETSDSLFDYDLLWDYSGSILSSLNEKLLLPGSFFDQFKKAVLGIASLELLSPATLKKSSRTIVRRIGMSGENLPSFIHSLSKEQKEHLTRELQRFYPQVTEIKTKRKVGGWVNLSFEETFSDYKTHSKSIHINDGLLRVLAILAQRDCGLPTLLLLDEIENGINQEIMQDLVRFLAEGGVQVVATTHSPLLLNYLKDQEAKQSMYFAYRTNRGCVEIKRFFDIIDEPGLLDFAGPGEIYANTDLRALSEKCRNWPSNT